jgi:hypothetical protein
MLQGASKRADFGEAPLAPEVMLRSRGPEAEKAKTHVACLVAFMSP